MKYLSPRVKLLRLNCSARRGSRESFSWKAEYGLCSSRAPVCGSEPRANPPPARMSRSITRSAAGETRQSVSARNGVPASSSRRCTAQSRSFHHRHRRSALMLPLGAELSANQPALNSIFDRSALYLAHVRFAAISDGLAFDHGKRSCCLTGLMLSPWFLRYIRVHHHFAGQKRLSCERVH